MKYTSINVLALLLLALPIATFATTPEFMVYEGRLLNSSQQPITTPVTVRFSFWKNADFVPAHLSGTAINTSAFMYGGWMEVQTITPNSSGIISANLGTITALPTIDGASQKYLQVEVKNQGEPDSSYQMIDPTGDNGADDNDRQALGSMPYAKIADSVAGYTPGSGSGNLMILGSGGTINADQASNATNAHTFTIDAGDTSTSPALQFGRTLAQTLSYNTVQSRFEFSDDVQINGDLTVTGLINGVDVSTLGIAREQAVTQVFYPGYEGASYMADGTDNVGQLAITHDDTSKNNYYAWTSTRAGLQDYDIVLKARLPDDFDHWQGTGAITVGYRTTSANSGDNSIDVQVLDTANTPVTLSNTATGLTSTAWATATFDYTGTPTWTAGESMLITIKLHTKDLFQAHLGEIHLRYVRLGGN